MRDLLIGILTLALFSSILLTGCEEECVPLFPEYCNNELELLRKGIINEHEYNRSVEYRGCCPL